jgi:hypothetical protein
MDNLMLYYIIPAVLGFVLAEIFSILGKGDESFIREMRGARIMAIAPILNILVCIVLLGVIIRVCIDYINSKR